MVVNSKLGGAPPVMSQTLTKTLVTTKTIVKVSQKQSLNIIKTTALAALSSILWIRNIFPQDLFESRRYNLADPNFPHSVDDKHSPQATRAQQRDETGVYWDILLKNKHPHADKILSWLDGATDALQRQYLETLQLCFYDGSAAKESLCEAYVLRFSYQKGTALMELDVESQNGSARISTKDLNDLKAMFHRLAQLAAQGLRTLPAHPTVAMFLTYNTDCPAEYNPIGFVDASAGSILDDEAAGAFKTGSVSTKFHRLAVSIIQSPLSRNASPAQDPAAAAATHLATSPLRNKRLILDEAQVLSSQSSSGLNTQDKEDRTMIRSMVHPLEKLQDTQRLASPAHEPARVNDQSKTLLDGAKPAHKISFEDPPCISLAVPRVGASDLASSGRTLESLRANRTYRFSEDVLLARCPDVDGLGYLQQSIDDNGPIMGCACGIAFSIDTMLCQKCQRRQHRTCYGYTANDTLIGPHLCYECLADGNRVLVKRLTEQCSMRIVISALLKYGAETKWLTLRDKTGCLLRELKTMVATLRTEGYLSSKPSQGATARQSTTAGKTIVGHAFTDAEQVRLLGDYFNPTRMIEDKLLLVTPDHTKRFSEDAENNSPSQFKTPAERTVSPTTPSQRSPKAQAPISPGARKILLASNLFDSDDDDGDNEENLSETQGTPSQVASPPSAQRSASLRNHPIGSIVKTRPQWKVQGKPVEVSGLSLGLAASPTQNTQKSPVALPNALAARAGEKRKFPPTGNGAGSSRPYKKHKGPSTSRSPCRIMRITHIDGDLEYMEG